MSSFQTLFDVEFTDPKISLILLGSIKGVHFVDDSMSNSCLNQIVPEWLFYFYIKAGKNMVNSSENLSKKRILKTALIYILAFISILALFFSHSFITNKNDAKQIIWVLAFMLLISMYRKAAQFDRKRERRVAAVIAFIFSVFFTVGTELKRSIGLGAFINSSFGLFGFIICLVGLTALFYALIIIAFDFVEKHGMSQTKPSKIWFANNRRSFLIIWVAIFFCWIPYLLVFYPGFFTTDSVREFQMGLGAIEFTSHHTIIHTLLMSAFIRIGEALGSQTTGAGLYSLIQMAVMSMIFSLTLYYLAFRNVRTSIRLCILAYFAFFPVNAMYSMTGWKNIIFAGLCLMLFILIVEIFRRAETILFSKLWVSIICFVSVLFCLFLKNGVYVLVLFLPFFIVSMRKYWKKVIPIVVICAVTISAFDWCAYSVLSVKKSNISEAMSVPLQQIARTVQKHGNELSQSETEALQRYFYVERLPELYNPLLSDPVKGRGFKQDAFLDDVSGFIKIWAKLGLKYPEAFISSFLCNSYGYWYPDVNYWVVFFSVRDDAVIQVKRESFFPSIEALAKKAIETIIEYVPVLSMLSSIGFVVWLIIFSVGFIIAKRKKNLLVPILLPGFVWLTAFASPVYAEYRYVYGVMLCAPVILILAVLNDGSEKCVERSTGNASPVAEV